ncbi:MAG: MBL fold metallo-hydrolase, partial [Phycisphaerales bacterium]
CALPICGIELVAPTETFEDRLQLDVGGVRVELIHVGPSHAHGDTIVHVPEEGVVFAGDVAFCEVAPVGWVGTHERWMEALSLIESLAPRVVVPGHGPVCTFDDLREMRSYMERVRSQASAWHAQGLSSVEAATRIDVGRAEAWNAVDARVWFMVERAYREQRGEAFDAPWNVKKAFCHAHEVCRARGAEFEV